MSPAKYVTVENFVTRTCFMLVLTGDKEDLEYMTRN